MTDFQKWLLRRMARKIVIQGNHRSRIIEFYRILLYAARTEFREDNDVTLNDFLEECHKEASNKRS